ncbi:MAG: nickel-dependent lactate racemase [Firmicutes bacterium]|nr:nickel-dependent lactate racemase [Bacillota bacterium]
MMQTVSANLGALTVELHLPEATEIIKMNKPSTLSEPAAMIKAALKATSAGPSLEQVIQEKLKTNPEPKVVIVISDNTRPVPYSGENGILWPVIEELLAQGINAKQILILVATGTHRPVTMEELRLMLDPRVFAAEIPIRNHDCEDQENLVYLGETRRGTRVHINKYYMEADLKILTGLVESHFMAGASGGRKSVCPGLVGKESTYIFHSAPVLASPLARDLVLSDNPCHEEALEVAKKAGVDYIINVTLDQEFNLTGVFAGELEAAHRQAVKHLKSYVAIPLNKEYDIVVTHAGFVGLNHYQAAKVGVVSIPALKKGGRLIIVANTTDQDQIGNPTYRTMIHLLKMIGAERFNQLILSPDWVFIPDLWQAQMWTKLFAKIPPENLIYFSPSMSAHDYHILPCRDGNLYLPPEQRYGGDLASIPMVVTAAVTEEVERIRKEEKREATIAYLADGPYGIPFIPEADI